MKNSEKCIDLEIEPTLLTTNKNGNPNNVKINEISDKIESKNMVIFCKEHGIAKKTLFLAGTILALNKFTFTSKTLIGVSLYDKSNSPKIPKSNFPFLINNEKRQKTIREFLQQVNERLEIARVSSYDETEKDHGLKSEFVYSYYENCGIIDKNIKPDYKINLNIIDRPDCNELNIRYNNQLYTQKYMETFLNSIKNILNQIITSNIDQFKISDVALKKEKKYQKFKPVETPYMHKRFEKQVLENPKNIAITSNNESLTYEELNRKANRIANALIKKGVQPKSNILLMLPRNNNMVASILGILKAGCAFIPVDLEYPKERIDYIYENSQADYIITTKTTEKMINIEELLQEENIENPNVNIQPEDLAYLIYTSGSTGKPKGVMVSHLNISNLFAKNENSLIYGLYSKIKKNLSISTVSFDAFLLDFMSLTFGCQMVLANDSEIKNIVELTSLIIKEKPDTITCITPTRLKQYLEYDKFKKELDTFKYICVGGEKLTQELVDEVLKNSNAIIYNNYGPTETTVACNSKEITTPKKINVGKTLPNYITDVRDIDSKLLPDGVMGELYIGGIGVSKGYYNMEDKTKERFITLNNIPYYKSGDYAIMLPNGEIDVKGRIDNQIKLRGLRIEIDEIEYNLSTYPNIKQNIVLIKKINNVDYLCAYFISTEPIDTKDLKEFLKNKLPNYMVPSIFIAIDSLPLMPNGKIDAKQLPEPTIESNYVKPENELEEGICRIFSNVLNIETVGAKDNFFNIGGTSLTASNLIIELIKNDYPIKYDNIFNNPTPRKLAAFLSGENNEKEAYLEDIENYDYTQINKLLDENTLENFFEGKGENIGNVLLTGVTGFLGIHVLYEYLKNESGTAYCMLRKGKYDSCEERLTDLINYYFDEDIESYIGSRIILIEGDITQPDDFENLEGLPIDTVINCAAVVKHYSHDDYIFKVNVDGVVNEIEFAKENDVKFVHISTISVLSKPMNDEFDSNIKLNEQILYYKQDLSNKYVNSKFLAERAALEAAAEGLDVKVIRLGNLMGRYSDGHFQKNYDTNAFLNGIRSIKNIKAISDNMYHEEVEISPIDYVARIILALSKTPAKCRVFNCQNNSNMIHYGDIVNVMNLYDYGIKKVSEKEFKAVCEENMNENIQGLITSDLTMDNLKVELFEENIENSQTDAILESLNVEWPKIDENYLKRLIDYLNKLNFFENN